MKESVVADSACLIALERIGRIGLLPALFETILIPPEVEREFGIMHEWLRVETPQNADAVNSLKLLLDHGEAEAIALAVEKGARIILDDRQARNVAAGFGLRVVGTIGCLLKAKRQGILAAVRPVVEKLEAEGFYLSDALKAEAFRIAGE